MWLAQWARQRERCERHGRPFSECIDPETTWYPQRVVDYAAMHQAAAEWMYGELHKDRPWHDGTFTDWSATRSDRHPFGHSDGVAIYVDTEDRDPGDAFTTEEDARPSAS